MTYRVLLTGSRTWRDYARIALILDHLHDQHRDITIVHGACPEGADVLAALWVRSRSTGTGAVYEEPWPADWDAYGDRAGPLRNQAMVDSEPAECVAFIHNGSRGASHCAARAEAAGIPTTRYEVP